MEGSQHLLRRIPLLVTVAALLASCGGESGEEEAVEIPMPGAALECERVGYPCSMADVPIEVIEQSDAIGDEILSMLDTGASIADVNTWLADQENVVEVQWDETAVRYRLEGGRAFWVLRSSVFGTRSGPSGDPTFHVVRPPVYADVVGDDSPDKQALVLSPMLWDLKEFDGGAAVKSILAGTRGYEGGVKHHANPDRDKAGQVNIDSFKSWNSYDVIHVSTHGKRLCDDGGCRATIMAATLDAVLPEGPEPKAEKIKSLEENGLEIAKSEEKKKEDGTPVEFVVLSADFFVGQYGSGLDDTLIYVDACQTFGVRGTDLADALMGGTSVFVGWTESVYSGESSVAAEAFYTKLSEGGYTAQIAHDKMDSSLKLGTPPGPHPAPALTVGQRPDGGDLRIRDIVWVLDPATGEVLDGPVDVAIEGTTDDGEADAAPYRVQIDGITPEDAAAVVVHVAIDGVEADPVSLDGHVVNGEDQWILDGSIDLGYDVAEGQEVVVHAWVELHSGGESHHEAPVTLTGEGECVVGSWTLNGGDVEAIHSANLGEVAETASVGGSVTADFRADGTVTYEFNGWELENTTFTPSPLEGLRDLHGAVIYASNGTATGTWNLTEDGQLNLMVADFDTSVILTTVIADLVATNAVDPHLARTYVIPNGAVRYECSGNTLTIPWEPGEPVRWSRTGG